MMMWHWYCILGRILNEYWDATSIRVVREQLDRDARIKAYQEREELARIERLRKQQLYNGNFDNSLHEAQSIEFQLVLETDPITDNIIVEVPLLLVMNMKQHQSTITKNLPRCLHYLI
jgi:hypothetical protein